MGAWLSSHDKICGAYPCHRSVHSTQPTFIVFHNASGQYIRVFWIDYSGRKRIYSTLKPGAVHIQSTFQTHPWTFDILTNPPKAGESCNLPVVKVGTLASDFTPTNLVDIITQQQIIYPSGGTVAKRVTIIDSPSVPWCTYSHAEFFGTEYKKTVKEVMMVYSRMLKLRGATSRNHLGDLPMVSFYFYFLLVLEYFSRVSGINS
jgi:VHL beta domain